MTKRLSPKSTLDTLKSEARRRLKAMRAADPAATLRAAQHAVALDYGFEGWIALRTALADLALGRLSPQARADTFLRACTWGGDYSAARRILVRHPELARYDLLTAVVCGDLTEVGRHLAADPDAARRKAGPLEREPLLYLTYGRFDATNAVTIAGQLLELGADPNAWFDDGWENPFTPLCGAIGLGEGVQPPHPQVDELAALLLARGGNAYDTQALYNTSIAGDDVTWLDRLWTASEAQGVAARWRGEPYGRSPTMLDYLLGNAVGQNHLARAEWLLARGSDPNSPHSYSGQPIHALAQLSGFPAMTTLLEEHGARPAQLVGIQAFQGACLRLDEQDARALLAADPSLAENPAPLLAAAEFGRAPAVALLLSLGVSPKGLDHEGISPLHRAVQAGSLETANLLIDAGADLDLRERRWNGTPLSWAAVLGKPRLAERLAPLSHDVRALATLALTARLEAVLRAEPDRANHLLADSDAPTPLFCLPEDDGAAADVVRILLACGADPTVLNKHGRSAMDAARQRGLDEAAELLKAGG